jgi:hypothetical protein
VLYRINNSLYSTKSRLYFITIYCELKIQKFEKNNSSLTILKPTGHVMHQQFNIQQLYALSTLYLCVLYLPQNKQQLVPLTA